MIGDNELHLRHEAAAESAKCILAVVLPQWLECGRAARHHTQEFEQLRRQRGHEDWF
jgi:hypothetical protein